MIRKKMIKSISNLIAYSDWTLIKLSIVTVSQNMRSHNGKRHF